MADPTKFDPSYNFSNYQASNPATPLPGSQVDIQFQNLKTTTSETIDALKEIRRSDGALKNGIVTVDSFAPDVLAGVQGIQGPQGETGPEGPQGAQGVQGPTGPTGPAGPQGIQGVQGVQGVQGEAGQSFTPDAIGPSSEQSTYDDEAQGFSFLDATNGLLYFKLSATSADWSVGAMFGRGPQGPQGVQGIQGPQGPEGPTGPEGPAVDIAATINAATEKTTPVDADEFGIWDSISSGLRKLTWANLKATLLASTFLWAGGSQSLSQAQQAQVRDNVGAAASMDARPSLIVNGSMVDSQERGNTLGTTNGYFAADQWALYFTAATAAMSIQRVQSSKSLAGSANKLEFKTTTAKASLGASDFVMLSQPIEGSRPEFVAAGWGAAGAKQFVLRFEMTLPAGTYHVHVQNSAGNRHIAVPFVVTSGEANTTKVHEVVIPGDTSGTWLTGNGQIGMVIDIVLAAGATLTGGTASTWGATTYYAASTQKNILDSTSNVARLADVGLKPDPDATGVYGQYEVGEVHPVYRSERYVEFGYGIWSGSATSGAAYYLAVPLSIAKAKQPTVSSANIAVAGFPTGAVTTFAPPGAERVAFRASKIASATNTAAYYEFTWAAYARLS